MDEARRIARNLAKLTALLGAGAVGLRPVVGFGQRPLFASMAWPTPGATRAQSPTQPSEG